MESMAPASRARANVTRGTPEQCAKLWTTRVKRLTVDNMATVLQGVVSAQDDTRGPRAINPPNHVVQQRAPARPTTATRMPTNAALAAAAPPPHLSDPAPPSPGVTPIVQVGTAFAIGGADAHVHSRMVKLQFKFIKLLRGGLIIKQHKAHLAGIREGHLAKGNLVAEVAQLRLERDWDSYQLTAPFISACGLDRLSR